MIKKYVYIAFALFILVMSWEAQKSETVVAAPAIPQDAIRLRILANSDNTADQWLKREIRDDVVQYIQTNMKNVDHIETAREWIADHLPQLEQRVQQLTAAHGFSYNVSVDFGEVSFPTKMYGNQVYPAGDYEAVRISIGEASGANWWCVLFPPLCFVDMANADAVAAGSGQQLSDQRDEETTSEVTQTGAAEEQVEVRFFLLDWLFKVIDWFVQLFAKLFNSI